MMETSQVKSRERVMAHGEVFTAQREVKAMCDLVKDECQRIDSRFLEPACGEGVFLAEVLRRKLEVVRQTYAGQPKDFERYSVLAIMSLYGVELLEDNVAICRARLFAQWLAAFAPAMPDAACQAAVRYVLSRNILCGDALTMRHKDGQPLVFAEWTVVDDQIQRRDFRLDQLLKCADGTEHDLCNLADSWLDYDVQRGAYVPRPLREYPLACYREVPGAGA